MFDREKPQNACETVGFEGSAHEGELWMYLSATVYYYCHVMEEENISRKEWSILNKVRGKEHGCG